MIRQASSHSVALTVYGNLRTQINVFKCNSTPSVRIVVSTETDVTTNCGDNGFWIGLHRFRDDCSKPFVWDLYGVDDQLIEEQSWETVMWYSGEPNCAILNDVNSETVAHIRTGNLSYGYLLNDLNKTRQTCVICQIYA